MNIIHQSAHIARTFGLRHLIARVGQAAIVYLDNLRRNRQHRRMRKRLATTELEIHYLDAKLLVQTNDRGLHRDLLLDRIREPVATALLLNFFNADDVFLDIGANIGYYAILAARRCQHVFAIEPCLENFSNLQTNFKLNDITNATLLNLAVSDRRENLALDRSEKSNWHRTRKIEEKADLNCVRVSALSLDDLCLEHSITPSIIKFDIEGFEKVAVRGAHKTLSRARVLFFELHSTILSLKETNEVLDIVEKSGLKIFKIIRYDRPGLWREEDQEQLARIRLGDYGIYELFFVRQSSV